MELNTIKARTHWKPFLPLPDSALLHRFHQRRRAVLQEMSPTLLGCSFDFEGLLLAATPLDCSESCNL